jgi:hypothetical protein
VNHQFRYLPLLLAAVVTLLLAAPAHAYVGPGAGMEFIGYAMSLVAMVGIAFLSFISWPAHALIRWLRGTTRKPVQPADPAPPCNTSQPVDPAPPPTGPSPS